MTTVATTEIPELALPVAALAHLISGHLSGVYAVTVNAWDVSLQGDAADVAHIVADLGLGLSKEYDSDGRHYAIWCGPAPAPFAAVTVRVVAVS